MTDKDWKEYRKQAASKGDPPQVKTRDVLALLDERDALLKAAKAALPVVEFYAKLLESPDNRSHYMKIGKQLRAALGLAAKE